MGVVLLNGSAPGTTGLAALALVNYGHFTSMQVRDGAVQGLDLHLQRLRAATRELFSAELDEAGLRAWMRAAVARHAADGGPGSGPDCGLRVTVFSHAFDYRRPLQAVPLDVLVSTTPAAGAPATPLRVKSYPFMRPLPQLKHVATFPLFHYRRLAQQAGFDDALFTGTVGDSLHDCVLEGSVWNIGFWDGEGILWPRGPALRGTSESLLQSGLESLGVAQRTRPVLLDEVAGFAGAFAANASGIRLIAAIDGAEFAAPDQAAAGEREALLRRALAMQPWQAL